MHGTSLNRIKLTHRASRMDRRHFIVVVTATVFLLATLKTLYFKVSYFLETGTSIRWRDVFFSGDAIYGIISTTLVALVYLAIDGALKRAISEQSVAARYALTFVLTALAGGLVAASHMYFFMTVIYDMEAPAGRYLFDAAVQAFITPLTLMAALETFHYRGAWLKEQYKKEQQQKEAIAAKFEALSNQLSPHFVFNSFNTLGGLIREDTASAEKFLGELSKVYRYILDNKDRETLPLSEEIDSVKSFLSIQEARHPGTVRIDIRLENTNKDLRIIPLTLHTLVENVFKHNRLSAEQPIRITISLKGGEILMVENTVNPKLEVESHNIGLSNLSRRYEILAKKGLEIMCCTEFFRVHVPVLEAGGPSK